MNKKEITIKKYKSKCCVEVVIGRRPSGLPFDKYSECTTIQTVCSKCRKPCTIIKKDE